MALRRITPTSAAALVMALSLGAILAPSADARADGYLPIGGSGSTWAANLIDQARVNVAANYGLPASYSGTGSSAGRRDFVAGTVDFAVTELPFQSAPEDGSSPEVPGQDYTYIPAVAGATSFAYNLWINGARVNNLRLSSATITGIFTGAITQWNDPAIAQDNPTLTLPSEPVIPVVRSDGSGSTWQFTRWMLAEQPAAWTSYCGCTAATSQFPVPANGKAQNGSIGVAGYVSQDYGRGAITYVENSYALRAALTIAKVLNHDGYYVAPTPAAVSVALLGATVDSSHEQNLSGVYANPDSRAYPVSSYAYLVAPTAVGGIFTESKGASLGAFLRYLLCEGQQSASGYGYAALPLNLVQEGLSQIARIPGAGSAAFYCSNPTFEPGDTVEANLLLATAPMPPASDRADTSPDSTLGIPLSLQVMDANDGMLSLSAPNGGSATFLAPSLVDGQSVTLGSMPTLTVVDQRASTSPGWTLTAQLTDFASTANAATSISRSQLGLVPSIVSTDDAALPGASLEAGTATYPALYAEAVPGHGAGTTTLAGALRFVAPSAKPAGTYVATMTLTLVSQ